MLAPPGLAKVALTVNADDAMLDALMAAVPIDMVQLHGSESPDRGGGGARAHGTAGDEGAWHRGGRGSCPDRPLFRGWRTSF